MGRNLCYWEDSLCVHRQKRQDECEVYQNTILRGVLQPWAIEHFGENQFFLQQDWAPAHGAKTTIKACEELFPGFWGKDIWPSNSPDLNPLDFHLVNYRAETEQAF